MADTDDNILELAANRPRPGTWGRTGNAGTRYVRTPEGAEKYGLPIGAPITADAIARAKARGRSYTVPEDDKRFGSQQPTAGRTRRTVPEIVQGMSSSAPPRRVTPEGPKKIAVGERGFSFPEGSRAFRSNKHENFAIVRTPDYQLVVITERGNAFELDGDLERELNENLDDDQSPDFTPDEPNPNLGEPGAEDVEGEGVEVDAFRPDNLEDMPGYLTEDRIGEILSGLEEAGLDQGARDATELQLRRNNDRIREEFASAEAPGGPDGTESSPARPPVPTKPAAKAEAIRSQLPGARQPETLPMPTPDRQPESDEPAAAPKKERPAAKPKATPKAAPTKTNSESENSSTDDEQLATLEELTRSRPTAVAEGDVNGKRVSVRRNRVNDAMEYSADDESFPDRDTLLENTRKRVAPEEPRDTTDMEPEDLSDQELDDILADIDDALRAGMIFGAAPRERRRDLAAEKSKRTGEAPEEPEANGFEDEETVAVDFGSPTTREWAEGAKPGAAAQTADGILAQRTDEGWETPLGTVSPDFLGETDVVDDETVVVRNEPEPDNRPVGATTRITSPEEMEAVRPYDGVIYQDADGNQITATRRRDGDFDLRFPDGLRLDAVDPEILLGSGDDINLWHVPNQDMPEAPSRESWTAGDTLKSMTDVAAQKPGTRLRMRYRRPVLGVSEASFIVQGDGRVKGESGSIYPAKHIQPGVRAGRVSVAELPTRDIPDSEIETPRVVEDPSQYIDGDVISDYRHLRDMAPGSRVTLVVPASENGGREAQVVLTRTRDEADLGGFMFLVGNGGRGYNSFGENNANLFQAIHDGRLHFGDIKRLPDAGPERRIGGDWSRERNISLWEGGPDVSEYDLRTFIASQVASTAMQGSYYDVSLLPDDSPFRSRQLRDEFSARAIAQYSSPGNPARHKPAMIRLAAEKLGMQYTEPGSTLLPDNLTIEDFSTPVTLGRWLRGTGTSAEANMGPEQIKVTRADIKTALAVLDNMQVSDAAGDPDKILKRVFARQGSPLQDLNVAVAIASYFRMRRYKADSERPMTTIARQYDKRRNRALLRQMLREQLEGREPGYYGVPEDEVYEKNGVTYTNRSSLSRPEVNVTTDANPNAVPEWEQALMEPVDGGAVNGGVVEAPRVIEESNALTPRERREDLNAETNSFFDTLYPRHRNEDMHYAVSVFDLRQRNNPDLTQEEFARAQDGENWSEEQLAEARVAADARLRSLFARRQELRDLQAEIDAEAAERRVEGDENTNTGISEERLEELDDFDNHRDAYMNSRRVGDSVTYIREVLGDEGVEAMYTGSGSIRQQFRRAWNQRNGVSTEEPAVETPAPEAAPEPEAPARAFPMAARRREALDRMAWDDAWRNVQENNDALNYIEDVMGPEGIEALNDGSLSMRAQFVRAHEQANPDTYMTGRDAEPTVAVGQELGATEIGSLPAGSNVEYTRRDGRVSVYTRTDSGWTTARGGTPDPESWTRARFRVSRVGANDAQPEPMTADEIIDAGPGVNFVAIGPNGERREGRTDVDEMENRVIVTGDSTSARVTARLLSTAGWRFERSSGGPQTSETTDLDPRFAQGGSFTGASIREAPVGSHVRGASGREYRVTESGIQELGGGVFNEFATVERFNANFTYVGDTAPSAPVSAVARTAPDPRAGSWFDTDELMSLPRGGFVRSTGGTVWQLNGSFITSTTSGTRRRVRNLRPGRYRYLGTDASASPTPARGTAAADTRSIAEAGLSRVPQDVITRYDAPRPMPQVAFDTTNTAPFADYVRTPEGQEQLRLAVEGALPAGSRAQVSVTYDGSFSASYTTPDGSSGSMTRGIRGNGRIENAVARAGGANFSDVQDHLFAFYRQHGLTEVEVHGLSSRNWNGAHTWIRRGFRPDPDREGANFVGFANLRDNLQRIIRRTEGGEFPAYNEFLDEAKDLARRMTDLLNIRQNLMIEERNERLYQLWRELTYLGEVRDANGKTARGQRQSIGWRLLGNQSSETWYYGIRELDNYFQN